MEMKAIMFLATCLAIAMSAPGAADEISPATCPPIGRDFRIAPYLELAAALQKEGRDKAVRRLRSWADSGKYEDQVVILCRMLFEAKQGKEFRRPLIGRAAFFGGTGSADWPLEPIDLHEGVPILITRGYALGGFPEPSARYLELCTGNCKWREAPYSVRPAGELKEIIAAWMARRNWPQALSEHDRAFFIGQAGPG